MKTPLSAIITPILLLALLFAFAPRLSADEGARKRILIFTKSSAYEHWVISDRPVNAKQMPNPPGTALRVLKDLCQAHNFDAVFSKDGSKFNPKYLAGFDAFFFYTTGDLTDSGTDGKPPMTPEGKEAFLAAVNGGKGFVGVHSASDTFHSPRMPGAKDPFANDGDRTSAYVRMLGGEFVTHGAQQPSHLIVVDRSFPGASALAALPALTEEWYSFKNFAPDLHVIYMTDTTGMKGFPYARPPYPSTWARMQGHGRVFYSSLGHRDDIWRNPAYQALLVGALDWATGRVKADITPNLDKLPKAP